MKIKLVVLLFVLGLGLPSSSIAGTSFLDDASWHQGQASRQALRIGSEKNNVFLVDQKPTTVGEEDRKWFQMLLRSGWTYSRASFVRMRGTAFTSYGGFFGKEIFADWRGEVSWQSYILSNDGKKIVELRYYPEKNRIFFLKTAAEIRCDACISAGKYLTNLGQVWRDSENKPGVANSVKTWIGELMHVTGLNLKKAKYRFDKKRAKQVAELQSGQAEGSLSESMFSNVWYLLLFNTEEGQQDKIARIELEGNDFVSWAPTDKIESQQENVRRQVISRSAYLMDAALLPPDRKVDVVGKTWNVSANAFGQILGSDIATDLDRIAGEVKLKRRKNILSSRNTLIRITKFGSTKENRVQFVYRPKERMVGKTHQAVMIEPEQITILFDQNTTNISHIDFQGTTHVSVDAKNLLLPDVKFSAEPFFEAEYASSVLDRESWKSAISNGSRLLDLINRLLGVKINPGQPGV